MTGIRVLISATAFHILALAADPRAAELLTKASDTYKTLKSYRMEAVVRTEISTTTAMRQGEATYKLAAAQDKLRLTIKASEQDFLAVNDGETTWMYLPKTKQYSKRPASASLGGDDEEGADDPVVEAQRLLVTRFVNLRKVAPLAEFVREDTLKVGGKKVNCGVIQMMAREYWIDTSRFLMLKEVEVSRKKIQGGGELTTKTSVTWKDADINSVIADSVFAFTPPDKAKEVELLDIPWQRRVTLTGTHATDFGLKDLDGNEVTLSNLRGKVVLLNFWATWCPPCRKELPTIEALHKEFSGKGLVILGVNDEEKGTVRGFVTQNGYTFPTLLDSKSQAQKAYRAYSIPTLVLIDRQGLIVNHLVGGRGEPELRAALRAAGL